MQIEQHPFDRMVRWTKCTLIACFVVMALNLVNVFSVWFGRTALVQQMQQQQAQLTAQAQRISALEAAQGSPGARR